MNRARLVFAVLALAAAAGAFAHGAVQQQIDDTTAALARDPANEKLYLRRAELHRVHEDWDAALADLDRAARLAPENDAIDFLRGRTLEQAGRANPARDALDRYLARNPDHVDALIARARALRALGELDAASADFARAIGRMSRPDPEVCLERARVDTARGEVDRALADIDAAIARLGAIASLQSFAIEVERKRGHADAALARLDVLAAQSARKESWLAWRGDILADAGRREEARAAYAAALAAIRALPAAMRRTPAIASLESRVRSALAST